MNDYMSSIGAERKRESTIEYRYLIENFKKKDIITYFGDRSIYSCEHFQMIKK